MEQGFGYGKWDCADFGPLIDNASSFRVAADTEVTLYQHCFDSGKD